MALLHNLLFWPPVPTVVTVIATANFLALINGGIDEIRGKHVQYSKLMGANSGAKIGSKAGMNIIYLFAFIFGAASFFIFPTNLQNYSRFFLLRTAITLHFFKRLLETLFIHKYSGEMTVETMVTCSVTYFMVAFNMIYSQYRSCELVEPSMDLKYVGLVLFVVGISGNLYHRYILSTLREKGEKEYKIPRGGLFGVVICPHYLFEVLGFWGLAFIAQTLCALLISVGVTLYLMGRSHATRKWYESKFEDFPTHINAIIPYTF